MKHTTAFEAERYGRMSDETLATRKAYLTENIATLKQRLATGETTAGGSYMKGGQWVSGNGLEVTLNSNLLALGCTETELAIRAAKAA